MRIRSIIYLFFLHGFFLRAQLPSSYINGHDVRLRSSPSLSGEVLFMMEKGTPAAILDKTKTKTTINSDTDFWYKISLSETGINADPSLKSKMTGWVFGKFLEQDSVFSTEHYWNEANNNHGESLPAIKRLFDYYWSACPWDVQYEYGICGMTFHRGLISFYSPEKSATEIYRIESAKEQSNTNFEIITRHLYSVYDNEYTGDGSDVVIKYPVPAEFLTLQLRVHGAFDSLEFSGIPDIETQTKHCPHFNKVFNSSMPVVFRITENHTPLFSYVHYASLDRYEEILDSAAGFADKGELFFHYGYQGYLLKPNEYAAFQPNFWHTLSAYPGPMNSSSDYFIPGSDLSSHVSPEEVVTFVQQKFESRHPEWSHTTPHKYFQDTEQGRRHLIVGSGYFQLYEPSGATIIRIINFHPASKITEYPALFRTDVSTEIYWDPKRNFLPYNFRYLPMELGEVFSWDETTQAPKSSFLNVSEVVKEVPWEKE